MPDSDKPNNPARGHSSGCLVIGALFAVPYLTTLLALAAWWLTWRIIGRPSVLTFARPDGGWAKNIFVLATVPPIAVLAAVIIPNVLDGVRHPRLFGNRTAYGWFLVAVLISTAMMGLLAWYLSTRVLFHG